MHALLNNLRPQRRLIFPSSFQDYFLTTKNLHTTEVKMHFYSFASDAMINSMPLKKSLIFLFHLYRFSPIFLKVAFSIAWFLHLRSFGVKNKVI